MKRYLSLIISLFLFASLYAEKNEIILKPSRPTSSLNITKIPEVNFDKDLGYLEIKINDGTQSVLEIKNQSGETEYVQPLFPSSVKQSVPIPLNDSGNYSISIESSINTYTGNIYIE